MCASVCVHCGSVFYYRDSCSLPYKHWRTLVHFPFGYTTQSTAGPGKVSVHECHHHKHSIQMCRCFPGGGVRITGGLAIASKRRVKKMTSFPYVLKSTVVKFLHYLDAPCTQKLKCSLRHNDSLSR